MLRCTADMCDSPGQNDLVFFWNGDHESPDRSLDQGVMESTLCIEKIVSYLASKNT